MASEVENRIAIWVSDGVGFDTKYMCLVGLLHGYFRASVSGNDAWPGWLDRAEGSSLLAIRSGQTFGRSPMSPSPNGHLMTDHLALFGRSIAVRSTGTCITSGARR